MKKFVDFIIEKLNITGNKGVGRAKILCALVPVIGLGFVCTLACIVLFNSAFGWFYSAKQMSATGVTVQADYDDMNTEFFVYMCEKGIKTASDRPASGDAYTLADLTFHEYDIIFKEMNPYTAVLVRMAITGEDVAEEGTISITLTRADTLPVCDEEGTPSGETVDRATLDAEKHLNDYFCSVIRFYCGADEEVYDGSSIDNMYKTAQANCENTSKGWLESKAFITCDDESATEKTYTHVPTLVFEVPYTAADWADGVLNIYLYMAYDEFLASEYAGGMDSFGKNIEKGNNKVLTNDLALISLSH